MSLNFKNFKNVNTKNNNKGEMNMSKNTNNANVKETKKGGLKSLLTPAVIITAMSTAITLYGSYQKSKKAVQGLQYAVKKARE